MLCFWDVALETFLWLIIMDNLNIGSHVQFGLNLSVEPSSDPFVNINLQMFITKINGMFFTKVLEIVPIFVIRTIVIQ